MIQRRFLQGLALGILLLGMTPTISHAQAYAGPTLTAAQKAKAQARGKRMGADIQALQADTKLTQPQKQAKYLELQKAYRADMMSYLTPAQRADVTVHQKAAAAKMQQMNALGLKLSKSLTPDQKKKIQGLGTEANAQMQQLQGDKTATQQQKKAKMMDVQKQMEAKFLAILTPTQRDEFNKINQMRKSMAAPSGAPAHR